MPAFDARLFAFRFYLVVAALMLSMFLLAGVPALAQSELATVFGRVTDPSGAVVAGAEVEVRNVDSGISITSATNSDGLYTVPSLHPGHYVISVHKPGFRSVSATGLELNVQDNVARNFSLQVGSAAESVTVTAEEPNINTTDATVSTVVDRNFAENLPMNGRSFQTLIQLTPGVVSTASNFLDSAQFSVNGQRPNSNYWMVDGVSANVGMSASGLVSSGLAGALGSFSVQGGTNSLVSVDALQEFRIQTSTYAPEFGRTPGGQISIVTRPGTNQWHSTLFDYLRNDVLDANDWFNGFVNTPPLPKAEERQNDFGGTFSGPITRDRTFFFFSYEGLRLRLPRTSLTTVPDAASRQNAAAAMQPFLNAFPVPNGPEILDSQGNSTGAAQFNASFSNRSTLDAYSLRLDHRFNDNLNSFARYDYSPSLVISRGQNASLSTLQKAQITTQTATVGGTWFISPRLDSDFRFNYSRTRSPSTLTLDNFGGAVPLQGFPFPNSFAPGNSILALDVLGLTNGSLNLGNNGLSIQNQFNVVETISAQRGSHGLKFGVDYRRLSPLVKPTGYSQSPFFSDVPSFAQGDLLFYSVVTERESTLLFRNLGAYAQDTWRVGSRLTLTYGLRWDVDFAPSSEHGPNITAVTGFNLHDLSSLSLAPVGTMPFSTPFANIAPRLGGAYQLRKNPNWGTVLRGGVGSFYDLATSEMGNLISSAAYPFAAFAFNFGGNFPLDPAAAAPPAIIPPGGGQGTLTAFDPNLRLPYTLQWNVAVEQGLGAQQSLSISYLGAAGKRLLQTEQIFSPNPEFAFARLVSNTAISDYDALQLQLKRRLSRGLQALASYTWSHSIDTASAGSYANTSNTFVPANGNRGPSDFDIRNAFSAGATYVVPAPQLPYGMNAILRNWSFQTAIQARSATPVNVHDSDLSSLLNISTEIRPDLDTSLPLYLYGPQYPGGRALNNTTDPRRPGCKGPFCPPPTDPNTGAPLRQGNLGRNALRAFGAVQWDFAVHRDFPLTERVDLQFRAEMFNILNHPNFGPPDSDLSHPQFGVANSSLASSLNGGTLGSGALSPLYQIGGPRSIQFALKLLF